MRPPLVVGGQGKKPMTDNPNELYGLNVLANGRNLNAIRLLTGLSAGRSGHILRQLNFHINEGTVLIIMKKDSPKGPMVAFLEGATLDDALYVVAAAVKSKTVPWKPDKWRTTRNDKK